jgi:hypothetical protein
VVGAAEVIGALPVLVVFAILGLVLKKTVEKGEEAGQK